MSSLEAVLQAIGYHVAKAQPFLPTYIHVLSTALIAIYTGAHASLFRPKSAVKPPKKRKQADSDDDDDEEASETVRKMEGLSPSDAVMFPLLAGCTLAGLYYLIKWLKDPAILNMILNWYFAIFGVLSVARLFTDAMGVWTSFIFPAKYISDGKVWEINRKQRAAESSAYPADRRVSPLPGRWSKLPLPSYIVDSLWTMRELPAKRIQIRVYIHRILEANLHLGPQGTLGFILALIAVLYYNLVAKPWWLTNILGGSFAYASLQFMSPSTTWTATLILGALFVYDIYFVFFTPMMVTVATKIDIPAKMLFPRPADPGGDSTKSLAMLGLGDIVLPGIVIGFALRFDLYMFYLKKQRRQESLGRAGGSYFGSAIAQEGATQTTRFPYRTATGSWGERFWLSTSLLSSHSASPILGVTFPKTYFRASIFGYTAGMITTLSIMQIFGHAQPALLYLVPGVLIALWGTALVRGELKDMWDYDEGEDDEKGDTKDDKKDYRKDEQKDEQKKEGKKSIFSWSRQDDITKRLQKAVGVKADEDEIAKATEQKADATTESKDYKQKGFSRNRTTELIFFSINLPNSTMNKSTQGQSEENNAGHSTTIVPGNQDKQKDSIPKRGKTAYMFFANENPTKLNEENAGTRFGQVGPEFRRRWEALTPEQRAPYEEMERKDREWLEAEQAFEETDNGEGEEGADEVTRGALADVKKHDPNAPLRNMSPYCHFAGHRRDQVRQENPGAEFAQIASILGQEWDALGSVERGLYERMGEQDKERYEREKAEYDAAHGDGGDGE